MKKKFLSIFLVFIIIASNITIFANENSAKDNMEQYIKNLTDVGGMMKYTEYPLGEYNDAVSKKVFNSNDETDWMMAAGEIISNATSMLSWAFKNGFSNTNAYSEAKYEAIFAEWLAKSTGKTTEQEVLGLLDDNAFLVNDSLGYVETLEKIGADYSKKVDTTTAYKRLYESLSGDWELMDELNDSDALRILGIVNTMYVALVRNYENNEKYLEIMSSVVNEMATQEENSANSCSDKKQAESMRKEANAMRTAINKVILQYRNRVSGQFEAFADGVITAFKDDFKNELLDFADDATDALLKKMNVSFASRLGGVFALFDLSTFGLELITKATGIDKATEAYSNTIFMYPITLKMQNEFFDEGKQRLSDGNFSDEDYEYMSLIFDLCYSSQSLNCEYADVNFNPLNLSKDWIIEKYLSDANSKKNPVTTDPTQHETRSKCGDNLYWEIDENGVLTITGSGEMYNSSDDYLYENIHPFFSSNAFGDNAEKIKSVKFPDGITTIGGYAFTGSTNLTKIEIPKSVTCIFDNAFSGCTNLKEVVLHDNITDIGNGAFSGCTSLKSITLPKKLTRVAQSVLANTPIETLVIPESVTLVADNVFNEMKSLKNIYMLTKNDVFGVGLGDMFGVTYNFTVYGYENAKKWVEKMNSSNGMGWAKPHEIKYVPLNSDTIIPGEETKENKETNINNQEKTETNTSNQDIHTETPKPVQQEITVNLNGVPIKFDVPPQIINDRTMVPVRAIFEALGAEVLWNEASEKVTAHRGNQTVELIIGSTNMYTSSGNYTLDSPAIIINGRTLVPARAVAEAFGCIVDWNEAENKVIITESNVSNDISVSGSDVVNSGSCGENVTWTLNSNNELKISGTGMINVDYDTREYWKPIVKTVIIEDGITGIGPSSFSHCSNIENVSIPDSVQILENNAFDYCTSLKSIKIPSSVKIIRDMAFRSCHSLTELIIPEGVEEIQFYSFLSCTGLTEIELPKSMKILGTSSFEGCRNLKKLTIPAEISEISYYCFSYCDNLTIYYGGDEQQWSDAYKDFRDKPNIIYQFTN